MVVDHYRRTVERLHDDMARPESDVAGALTEAARKGGVVSGPGIGFAHDKRAAEVHAQLASTSWSAKRGAARWSACSLMVVRSRETRSDVRVGHELAYVLCAAARDGDLGRPAQRLLA